MIYRKLIEDGRLIAIFAGSTSKNLVRPHAWTPIVGAAFDALQKLNWSSENEGPGGTTYEGLLPLELVISGETLAGAGKSDDMITPVGLKWLEKHGLPLADKFHNKAFCWWAGPNGPTTVAIDVIEKSGVCIHTVTYDTIVGNQSTVDTLQVLAARTKTCDKLAKHLGEHNLSFTLKFKP